MKTVQDIISRIKEKPAMYIGYNSIFCLQAFLNGVCWENPTISNPFFLNEFQQWVVQKYGISYSQSWAEIIRFFSADDYDAMNTFFKDFDDFLLAKKMMTDENT